MGEKLDLSVVDQSPGRKGGTAADALRETMEMAIAPESPGGVKPVDTCRSYGGHARLVSLLLLHNSPTRSGFNSASVIRPKEVADFGVELVRGLHVAKMTDPW